MSRPMDVGNAMRHCSHDSSRNILRDFISLARCGGAEGRGNGVLDYHATLFCGSSKVVWVMKEWATKLGAD